MDGIMGDLRFGVLFNSISVKSGGWKGISCKGCVCNGTPFMVEMIFFSRKYEYLSWVSGLNTRICHGGH